MIESNICKISCLPKAKKTLAWSGRTRKGDTVEVWRRFFAGKVAWFIKNKLYPEANFGTIPTKKAAIKKAEMIISAFDNPVPNLFSEASFSKMKGGDA